MFLLTSYASTLSHSVSVFICESVLKIYLKIRKKYILCIRIVTLTRRLVFGHFIRWRICGYLGFREWALGTLEFYFSVHRKISDICTMYSPSGTTPCRTPETKQNLITKFIHNKLYNWLSVGDIYYVTELH